MAYPTDLAATLSGASVRQLAYWRRPDSTGDRLLVPELRHAGRPLLYSFRDLLALRTFVFLREQHSLQMVRRAVASLRDLGNRDHLARYRLVADGSNIVWADDADVSTDLTRRPGHLLLNLRLADVVAEFAHGGGRVVDLYQPRKLLGVDPEVCGGYPVVAGTRVLFDQVASLVADGVRPEDIGRYFPGVSGEAAKDALSLAAEVHGIAA